MMRESEIKAELLELERLGKQSDEKVLVRFIIKFIKFVKLYLAFHAKRMLDSSGGMLWSCFVSIIKPRFENKRITFKWHLYYLLCY